MHYKSSYIFAAGAAALLFACSTSTTTTSGESDPGAGSEEPADEPSEKTSPTPEDPPPPAKPPTMKVDPTFAGGAGISDSKNDVSSAAPGADGTIYVALRKAGGSIGWGAGTLLRRYLKDGTLDASFASAGELDTKLVAQPAALATDAKGNVLVGGTGLYDPGNTSDTGREIVVVRVTAAGTVDTTYGSGGRTKLSFSPANVWTTSLRVRDDGGAFISVYGRTDGSDRFGSFLVGPTGTPVGGYGTNGFMTSPFPTDGAVALESDVAVPTSSGLALYGPDGKSKGFAIKDGVAMAKVASDGAFLAVVTDGKSFSLARFSSTGALDKTFAASPLSDGFSDLLPLTDKSVLVADGADVTWVSPKGGASTVLVKGASAGKLATTSDGKVLVITTGGKVLRYTL